ncbi:MAG: SGNH/GDSL hydrolase family protein [Planctomycetaceae bacterium]
MAFLGWIRKLVVTLLLVLFLAGSAEFGLRMSTVIHQQSLISSPTENDLVTPCWQAQYQLKPLSLHQSTNPDTLQPVIIRTNEWGVRGGNYSVPKPAGVFRILNLGDESTLAASVSDEETFSHQLQLAMQPMMKDQLEVINAGVPGYCPLLGYLKLKHTLMALQPDLVIYHFDMTDIADDYRARRQLILENGVAQVCPHPNLVNSTQPQQKFCQQLMLIQRGSELWAEKAGTTDLMSDRMDISSPLGRLSWTLDHPPDWSHYIDHALEPLALMKELVENSQAMFVVSTMPKPWQVSAAASNGGNIRASYGLNQNQLYASNVPFQTVQQYCSDHSLRYCSLTPYLRQAEHSENLFMQNAAEFSPNGHLFYARLLARSLYQQYTQPAPKANSSSPPTSAP